MININFDLAQFQKDLNKVADNVLALEATMKAGGMIAAKKIAKDIYLESQELVPVDTHNLKGTARFDEIENGYEIVYSAADDGSGYNYALIQHEDLTFKHDNGEQAKYLEKPFKEKIDGLEGEIVKEIKL